MKIVAKAYKAFISLLSPRRQGSYRHLFYLFCSAIMILLVVLGIGLFRIRDLTPNEWGDFFGGVANPILTFLTFTGLLITIILQQTELRETRKELKRSADALSAQNESRKKQNFEATFFQMLSIHNSIVNSIDLLNDKGDRNQGRDCFSVFYTRFNKIFRAREARYNESKRAKKPLSAAYTEFWNTHQSELGHYYRYLYSIVRFIKDEGQEGGPYIRLIRAQLSDQELLLLFYNCISENGGNFTPLVVEFSLLDNMPRMKVLDRSHLNLIAPRAFDRNAL
ncbi:putative phage abortive infection protein [Xanthomonas campestris]|uniref:putative phage abortive infection protein n=1 Tax=Xanthomonas campestris TaxID=339 RepID=UPI001E318621|nr:putative phage abortive infection protein [Xanthomonas campestris]MCC5086430.1 putative phage abortive infection protein [Xanthomonas campestris]